VFKINQTFFVTKGKLLGWLKSGPVEFLGGLFGSIGYFSQIMDTRYLQNNKAI
jgi:hypothetical protein